jgi:hypothetical protein
MIPQKKKTPEEIAALREGLGMPPEAAPPPPPPLNQESSAPIAEPIVHLDPPPAPVQPKRVEPKPIHSLRKHDPPLAPAPATTQRTELPTGRHDSRDISQIRKREALAALQQPSMDPAAYLRKQTASLFICLPGYLLAIAAGIAAYQRFHYITPVALLTISAFIMVFIAWQKPRSRHHAALLFIIVFLTLVFGALHYAPLFKDGP